MSSRPASPKIPLTRSSRSLLTFGLLVGCAGEGSGGTADGVAASTSAEALPPAASTTVSAGPTQSQQAERPVTEPTSPGTGTEADTTSSTPSEPSMVHAEAGEPTSTMSPMPTELAMGPGGQGGTASGANAGQGGLPNLGGVGGTAIAGASGASSPSTGGVGEAGGGGLGGASGAAGGSVGPIDFCDASGFSQVLTVNADGGADFTTVQAAVDSLDSDDSAPVLVQIAPGSYKEKLAIADRSFITFCGESAESTVLTFDLNNEAAGGTSASASTTIDANDFSAVNITFENSRPIGSGQAVAILLRGERQQFLDCRFIGFQDTLYVHHGTQYFRNCYVQGTVDYIFGGSAAVLEDCTMYNAGSGSAVTAPNTELTQPYGIVFFRGELTASDDIGPDSVALGRPWGADGSTVFIETVLGDYIKRVGWVEMSGNSPSNARFAEYRTSGSGASPESRVAGSKQLTDEEAAEYTLENILGGWTPSFSER